MSVSKTLQLSWHSSIKELESDSSGCLLIHCSTILLLKLPLKPVREAFLFPLLGNGGSGCMSVGFPVMMMWCEEDSFRLIGPGLLWSAWLNIALRTACGQLDPLSLQLTTQTWSLTHKHFSSGRVHCLLSLCPSEVCNICQFWVSVSWTMI